jgi:hypothetical protein
MAQSMVQSMTQRISRRHFTSPSRRCFFDREQTLFAVAARPFVALMEALGEAGTR